MICSPPIYSQASPKATEGNCQINSRLRIVQFYWWQKCQWIWMTIVLGIILCIFISKTNISSIPPIWLYSRKWTKYHFPCSLPTFIQVFVIMLENRLASTSSFRPDPLQLESGFRPDLRKGNLKKCRKIVFSKTWGHKASLVHSSLWRSCPNFP